MNGSTKLKRGSPSSSAPDPLDRARDALEEAKEARKLLEYSEDFEEPTGRTEVTVNLREPQQSSPQLAATAAVTPQVEVSQPEPGVLRIAFTAVKQLSGWPLFWTLAVVAACYTFLKWAGKL